MLKSLLLYFIILFSAHGKTIYQVSLGSPKEWVGISKLLYAEIAKEMKDTTFEISKIPSKRVIKELIKGTYDVEVGWHKDNVNSKELVFTNTPIVELNFAVITNNPEKFKNIGQRGLTGLTLGIPRGAHYIHHKIPVDVRYEVNRLEQAFDLLDIGRIDGVVTTIQNFKNIMKKSRNKKYKIINELGYMIKLYPMLAKRNIILRDSIEVGLQRMRKNGAYKRIKKKTGIQLLEKDLQN
ncbi:ABC transporter substrate-binding protein [Halobacteriovorax sp. HLS]|uniref:substrate-binding periplasmic protein n=1 Tax=Halobacteriovorax sp. HLS TaxID=2234000 RepID=UPI000FD6BAD7|nr:transporter substrate-binding domain-containing protein [Halobacteriovorax sp. HLS]